MIVPLIKQVPPESVGGKILFVGTDGRFYNAQGRELKPQFSPYSRTRKKGYCYPMMRHFAARLCHHLVYETFVGPRTKGLEIDHINGNKLDWRLVNLRQITNAENVRCAKILRAMRAVGLNPASYKQEELLNIFDKYEINDQPFNDKNYD